MHKSIIPVLSAAALLVISTSCSVFEVEDVVDPNNASVETIQQNATAAQINQLGIGLQSVARNGFLSFYREAGTVGREVVYSASTESRYYTELLGLGRDKLGGANDPGGIFNAYYNSFSQTRKRADNFILAAENTSSITEEQKNGVRGYANTIKALVTLNLVNMQGDNGIRESFSDLLAPGDGLKPGKFGTYASGLALCKQFVEDGAKQLQAAGESFPFTMTAGYNSFNTPANFLKFNRAIAARIAMYQQDWQGMQTALSASFLDLNGSLTNGPRFTYSTTAGDIANPFYQNRNTNGAPFLVFYDFVPNAETGDTRVTSKASKRTTARQISGIATPFDYEVFMYSSNTAAQPIIKNEELMLMYAEAKLQLNDLAEAEKAINVVRKGSGLTDYTGAKTKDALLTELLKQRRYSLFFEGHRWFDLKRYNRIAELPLQSDGFGVYTQMARPQAEVDWDVANP